MADEYISRERAKAEIRKKFPVLAERIEINGVLNFIPAADVHPVRHGRWQITDAYPHNVYCSECHKRFAQTHWAVWEDGSLPRAYCPNCGAKMDKEG